uniref:Uncharacterized protein n=1 Tax=Anguilla anguilla TaxID=7936 RepID=A0A0E9RQS3_ANGAN
MAVNVNFLFYNRTLELNLHFD